MVRRPPRSTRTDTRFPYTTLFRSRVACAARPPHGSLPRALHCALHFAVRALRLDDYRYRRIPAVAPEPAVIPVQLGRHHAVVAGHLAILLVADRLAAAAPLVVHMYRSHAPGTSQS